MKLVVIKRNSATENSRHEEANEHVIAIEEDGSGEVNFMTTVKICEYTLAWKIYDIDDVRFSYLLEFKDEAQDEFREKESTVEEVDQSGMGSSPQEMSDSEGLEDHLP